MDMAAEGCGLFRTAAGIGSTKAGSPAGASTASKKDGGESLFPEHSGLLSPWSALLAVSSSADRAERREGERERQLPIAVCSTATVSEIERALVGLT